MKFKNWYPFFSRSGSEIATLMKRTGKLPEKIITNIPKEEAEIRITKWLYQNYLDRIVFLPNRPSTEDYFEVIGDPSENPLVTLHGWLRILPDEVCNRYEIFNGHPGLVNKFPELEGKDPQIRAYMGNYNIAGSILHRVTPEVDKGEILFFEEVSIEKLNLYEVFDILVDTSLTTWIKFFDKVIWLKK